MSIDPEQVTKSPFVMGALGAVVTAFRFTPGVGLIQKVINVFTGSLAAGVVTPAFVEWLHHETSQSFMNCAAFLMGLLGMSLTAALLDWISSGKMAEALSSWVGRKP